MVGKDSSSKRKTTKRKRDKTSSQKKSRRKETKRHNRIQDSVPSNSDDVSSNSEHTSKSNHKRRIKIQKSKKPRRDYTTSSSSDDRFLSSDSDSDSDSSLRKKAKRSRPNLKKKSRERSKRARGEGDNERSGKKRKRSGKDDVVKPKKKKSSKKKIKKHSSSDSESCSISQSISGSDTADRKRRRSKLILDGEKERPRGRELYKSRKSLRIRSPSRSSCDRGSKLIVGDGALSPVNDDYNHINNNSRRLKSVIAVVDQRQRYDEEENKLDPYKEEIVYDRNDYPSPKSPDSNEEETKMELDELELKSSINDGDQNNDDMNNFEKEKEIENSVPLADLGGDVLESILRQKALENLKKFKGSLQTRPMSTNNLKVSDVKTKNVENEPTKPDFQELKQNSGPLLKSDISEIAGVKKLSDGENVEKEPETATQPVEQSTESVSKTDTCPGGEITKVGSDLVSEPSSSIGPTMTGEQSLEGGNEANDGSQFEQKTMTVMRGGEMVQVSYKVYIPKKAPALARRPLKR